MPELLQDDEGFYYLVNGGKVYVDFKGEQLKKFETKVNDRKGILEKIFGKRKGLI